MTLASDEEYPVVDFAVIYEVGHPLLAVEGVWPCQAAE
jgi:hypothetical protein